MSDLQPIPDALPRGRGAIYFETDHLKSELKKRTVRGGATTLTSQAIKFALNFLSIFVLYRLLKLGPADNGLVVMVATVTGVINLFKDMGLSRATVQQETITHRQTTALFWVNFAVGCCATLVAWALAPAVAWFYDNELRLIPIMLVMGSGFFFSGLSVQHQALMQRQMQFSYLAVIDVSSMLFGSVVAIIAAYFGAGYWALVVQQLAAVIANSAGQWIACGWRPGRFKRGAGIGSMLKFGGNLAGFNIINYVQRNADSVLVGKLAGKVGAGLYGQAFKLLMLPINQINTPMSNVAVPALSRLQSEPERYRSYYRKAIETLTFVTMPIVALLFVVADEAIVTLMGRQWEPTVRIFRWMAPAAFLGTFNVATGWVYVSLGRTDRQLRMVLVVAPLTVISFFLGGWYGQHYLEHPTVQGFGVALGVAAGGSLAVILTRYPTILYCFKGTPLSQKDLFAAIWRPSAASLSAAAAVWVLGHAVEVHHHEAVRFLVESALFAVLYVAAWLVLPGGRSFIANSKGLLKELAGKKSGQKKASNADPNTASDLLTASAPAATVKVA